MRKLNKLHEPIVPDENRLVNPKYMPPRRYAIDELEFVEPLGDRLLVRPRKRTENEKVLDSGLIIPKLGEDAPVALGDVVAVGREVYKMDVDDVVVYAPYAGFAMELRGEPLLLLSEYEVLLRITRAGVTADEVKVR